MAYAFWDIELGSLFAGIGAYDKTALAAALLLSLLAYVALGLRLHLMMVERPGVWTCTAASLVALGVNNIVPAKLGELAKVLYLQRLTGIGLPRMLALLFWERFADLNAVLLLAVITLLTMDVAHGRLVLIAVPVALVAGLWFGLLLLRAWPGLVSRMVGVLPGAGLRAFLAQVGDSVGYGLRGRGAARGLTVGTLLVWMLYAASALLIMLDAAELPISLAAALAVFAVASLGMAVPAAPGGLGVFEAAMVVSLGWFDVPRNEALACALVVHMLQFIPTTVAGLAVLARSGLSMRGLSEALERRRNARRESSV